MTNPKPEPLQPLTGQRQSGESDKAVQACNDWLRLGSGRTLPGLLDKYRKLPRKSVSTQSLNTLQSWSKHHDWAARATEFDASWEECKNAERKAVLEYYLSLDFERVRKLMALADFLEAQIYEQGEEGVFHNIWMPDVKQIGNGENAERVDIEHFNVGLLAQFRGTLEDIAAEVGGRIKKTDVTSQGEKVQAITLVEVVRPPNDTDTLPD